jgi:hypothetical protein
MLEVLLFIVAVCGLMESKLPTCHGVRASQFSSKGDWVASRYAELSMVIDKATELGNDLLDNTVSHTRVYQSALDLVEKIEVHQVLLRLTQDARLSKTRSLDLRISFAMDSTSIV